MLMDHQKLIDAIMDNDSNIRFSSVCNMSGELQVSRQKSDIEKFLSNEDTQRSLEYATKAWIHARRPYFKKIGKGLYTLTAYEKLKRVTIPLQDGFLLLATMDKTSDQNQIIDGILNLMNEGESKKCWNCNKVLEDREDEFCSKECDDLYYDLHKS
jgi:hypothetical protein